MLVFDSEPDDIPRVGKAHDLAAAIGQHLVEGDRPGLDAVDVRDLVAFGEQEFLLFHTTQGSLGQALLETRGRSCGTGWAEYRQAVRGGVLGLDGHRWAPSGIVQPHRLTMPVS